MTYNELGADSKLNMDIQFFAEGADGEQSDAAKDNTDTDESTENNSDTFDAETADDSTDNEMDSDAVRMSENELQSYVDKKVTQALKTAKKKQEQEFKKKQREQRLKEENKYKELYEDMKQELEEEKKQAQVDKLTNTANSALSNKSLDASFSEFVSIDAEMTEDDVTEKVDKLSRLVEAYSQRKIEELRNTDPRGLKKTGGAFTKESKADEARRNEVKSFYDKIHPQKTTNIFEQN